MGKIKVFTDSTNDLSPALIKENDIEVVPLYVGFEDGKTYMDGVDITTMELYEKVKSVGKLPKTAAPSPVNFYNVFKPYIDEGMDIIYIGISEQMSSTLQNAQIAALEFPEGRIEIVDSMNLSSGVGLLVLKAVDFIKEGLNVHEVAEKVRECVPKVRAQFVIDTLDYLYMGGRCSALQNFMSGIFKIKPMIQVVNGKMIVAEKTRGKFDKAIDNMLAYAVGEKDKIRKERIMITYSEESPYHYAEYLEKQIMEKIAPHAVYKTEAGCVISSHCGKGTIGILFIEE